MKSIWDLRDKVEEDRATKLDLEAVKATIESHVAQFVQECTGIERAHVSMQREGFRLYCNPNLDHREHHGYQKYLTIVSQPAPHFNDFVQLGEIDEAWVLFFEQFGWVRLGLLNITEDKHIVRVFEIGRKFDGFWAIMTFGSTQIA